MGKEIKVCPSCGSSDVKFADGGLHCSGCDGTFGISEKGKATPVDMGQIGKDHKRLDQVEKTVSEMKEKKPAPVKSDDSDYMDDSGGFVEFD